MAKEDVRELAKTFVPVMSNTQLNKTPNGNSDTPCPRSQAAEPEKKKQKLVASSTVISRAGVKPLASKQNGSSAKDEKLKSAKALDKPSTPLGQAMPPKLQASQHQTLGMTTCSAESPATLMASSLLHPKAPHQETQPPEIGFSDPPTEILVGHSIYDEQVNVLATLTNSNQPRLTFRVLKSQADDSDHGFCGKYRATQENINFLPQFKGTALETRNKLLALLKGEPEEDKTNNAPKPKAKKPDSESNKPTTVVLGEPIIDDGKPKGPQRRSVPASKRNHQANSSASAVKTALETIRQHLHQHDDEVKEFDNALFMQQNQINALEAKVEERDSQIRRFQDDTTNHALALQLEKETFAEQAQTIKRLREQISTLSENSDSQTSAPAASSEIATLSLSRPFSDVFSKIHETDLNGGKYREKHPKTVQRNGKTLLKSRMLQEVKFEMGSGEVMRDADFKIGNTVFSDYTAEQDRDGRVGTMKLVQKLGKDCLIKVADKGRSKGVKNAEERYFICWTEYDEAENEEDSGEE